MSDKSDERTWQLLPLTFRDLIDAIYSVKFNDCVIFGFDSVKDRMRWFTEHGYDLNKPIAIMVLGADREIQFKFKKSGLVEQMTLNSGSLAIIERNIDNLFEYRIVEQPMTSIVLIYQLSLG